jgi:deazaflavin-dependent oxidoreductase (nitroreductase family)
MPPTSLNRLPPIRYNIRGLTELTLPESEQYCYLTTTGRKSGQAHTIEIWFAQRPATSTLYMLAGSGNRADWVKNISSNHDVQAKIQDRVFSGTGRTITDPQEEALARQLIVKKYYKRDTVETTGWEAESLSMAIDLYIE